MRRYYRYGPPWQERDPREWHRMRGRFLMRIGMLMAVVSTLSCVGLAALAWSIGSGLGIVGSTRPQTLINVFGLLGVFFLLFGLLSAGRAFGRLALPIGDLVEASSRVADGDYSARVAERGPREIRNLAHAFNSMAARLEIADEQRRHMLADVTHELRTPLTIIQGNIEGLIDGVYPRDESHLTSILEETHVLSRLIDDLRTLALAESGALKLQKEPTDLAVLVNDTLASFKGQADATGISLAADIEPNLPTVEIDPSRIRQVLENLIANSLHFTPQGGSIRVQVLNERDGEQHVTVAVSDTGSGIPPEDLAHIFDRFHKSRDSHGTGLGLAIAKNLVAAHGGEISAQSQVGQGTTIRFTLPF